MARFERSALAAAIAVFSVQMASAADLPMDAIPIAAPPVSYTWSGCYVGGSVGGGWSSQQFVEDPSGTLGGGPYDLGGHSGQGVVGGGQIGCNWQSPSNWVWGIEGQFSAANINGSNLDPTFGSTMSSHIDFLGTAAVRLGYAAENNLLYVKGGGAWIDESFRQVRPINFNLPDATANVQRFGWMVGAGWEHALSSSWSIRLEYNYLDFGKHNQVFSDDLLLDPSIEQHVSTVMFGINYRFR